MARDGDHIDLNSPARNPASVDTKRGIPTVLVLPPMRRAEEADPLELIVAQSLVRDVTLTLCRARHFQVIAPFTAQQIVAKPPTEPEVVSIADYQVRSELFGGRTSTGGSVLSLNIIRNEPMKTIYTGEIEFGSACLLDVHFGLSAVLAETVSGQIAKEEVLRYRRTGSASAYVHYLMAMQYADRNDLGALLRARKSLARAVQLSPDYVPALSQLARTMTLEWIERAVPDRRLLVEARHLAERALSYDPIDSGSLREIGHASLYLHDIDAALSSYEAAEQSAPNHADLLADQADVLTHASRVEEAEERIVRALALNPLAPDDYYWIGGAVSFFRGRYEEGLGRLRTMKSPGLALRLMAGCAALSNDLEAAAAYRDRAMERDPKFRVANWTSLYPQPSKANTRHYLDALRLAGFK